MRCPHCGFEIEGEAAHCPNCGKAPGKSKRDRKYDGRPESIAAARETAEPTVTQPPKPEPPKREQPEVQQGDTQVFTPESRPTQPPVVELPKAEEKQSVENAVPKKKRKKKSIKKRILLSIVFVLSVTAIVIGWEIWNSDSLYESDKTSSTEPLYTLGDGTKEYHAWLTDVIPAGTWKTEDGTLELTIGSDNSVSWVRDGKSYVAERPTIYDTMRYEYPEGKPSVEEEAEYPRETYTTYEVSRIAEVGDEYVFLVMKVYRETATLGENIDKIDILDIDETGEMKSLCRVDS